MQRCGKVNNTMIWWPRKTNETNRFKVKTWRGFNLTILKVNQIHYQRIKVFTIKFNSKSIATSSSNLRANSDHMQTPNSQTPSLLGFTPTKAALLVTLRSHSKVSDHLHLLILYVATSTTLDLEILQGILPIEDFREVWVQKP